jgi:hypothetical protein
MLCCGRRAKISSIASFPQTFPQTRNSQDGRSIRCPWTILTGCTTRNRPAPGPASCGHRSQFHPRRRILFLKIDSLQKGLAWIDGIPLGRAWNAGPASLSFHAWKPAERRQEQPRSFQSASRWSACAADSGSCTLGAGQRPAEKSGSEQICSNRRAE